MTAAKKAAKKAAPPANPTVTFMGRALEVKVPTPETLVRWAKDISSLEKGGDMDLERLNGLITRMWDVIHGLVVHEADREWLRQGVDRNEISVLTAHSIVSDAAESQQNRAARRAK